jgi:hypothetical protein
MATQTNPSSKTGQNKNVSANRQRNGNSVSATRAGNAGDTAAADETYGIVSVLYHALQGAETYSQYIADAERAGNSELVEFFKECQSQENQRARRAKMLLANQLEEFEDDEDEEDDEK